MLILISLLVFMLVTLLFILFVLFTSADRAVLFSGSETLEHDGHQRTYRTYSKSGDIDKIIIGLHGYTGSGQRFAYYTALHNSIDDSTLVVYPDAIKPTKPGQQTGWNTGFCCGSGWKNDVDDAGFIMALVGQIRQDYNQPEADIYVVGFSNGAIMAQRLATDYPDQIAGIVAASGSIGLTSERLHPKQPVPVLLTHGKQDRRVPFGGGISSSDPDFNWLPFEKTVTVWEEVNGQAAPVEQQVYEEDAHEWHDWRILNIWNSRTEASEQAIEFIQRLAIPQ